MASKSGSWETKAVNYWKTYLAGAERCQFPKYDGEVKDNEAKSFVHEVDIQCLRKLQQMAFDDPVSFPVVLRAAWSIVLHCFTGLDDICFRYGENAEAALGQSGKIGDSLSELTLVRIKLDEKITLRAILERVHRDYLEGLQYNFGANHAAITDSLQLSRQQMCNTAMLMWKTGCENLREDISERMNGEGNDNEVSSAVA